MRIVVVGAGKVGYNLVKSLYQNGHYVSVIEKRRELCERLAEELPVLVIHGDAADLERLTEAGCQEADVLVGVTGTDQENLIVCQLAKKNFGIPKTIARINNPKNEPIFQTLGVDIIVSATTILTNLIEKEVTLDRLKTLAVFEHGQLTVNELELTEDSPVVGKSLTDVDLPPDALIIGLVRHGHVIVPRGNTILEAGDGLITVTAPHAERALFKALIGRRDGHESGR